MLGMRLSLRSKFIAAIAALVAIVLLANAIVLALLVRQMLRGQVEDRARAYASLAAGPVSEAYETYYRSGYSKFRELLLELLELEPDVELVTVYDTTGRNLFESFELQGSPLGGDIEASERTSDERMLQAVRGLDPVDWIAEDDSGRTTFVVVVPWVEEWGRHRYTVAFDFTYNSVGEVTRKAGRWIAWLGFGSLALGLVIAAFLSAQSLGPVETLTRGAKDLADGRLEHRIVLATGDEFEVLANTLNQMAARLSATVEDLEESNRVLNGLNTELQDLDRVKSDLLANVSHELRTPLTSIRGYGEALAEEMLGPVTRQQQEALRSVQSNADRLLAMIEELVGYSNLEGDRISLELRPFDLVPVARASVDALVASGSGHDVLLDCSAGLDPVFGDPDRIAQVFENLLTNAVKFTPDDGRITIQLEPDGKSVVVEVSDTGIGIEARDQRKVFDRFFQVDASTTRRYGGMGLGLAIVKEIVDRHGGEIEIESEPGRGTTFRFSIPFATGELSQPDLSQGASGEVAPS